MGNVEIKMSSNKNGTQVDFGYCNLNIEKLIYAIVDNCETENLIKYIKERLMSNALKNPDARQHQNDLKVFLNLFK